MHRLILLSLMLLSLPVAAQAQMIMKDSQYFMMDGKMTKEEMEEEASYIHGLCLFNQYQSTYFNCECLAGAFLSQREIQGPYAIQQDLMDDLTKSGDGKCANAPAIAGMAYRACQRYVSFARELESDEENEEYCRCVGNKTALDFESYANLDVLYIQDVRVNAYGYCEEPSNRARVPGVTQRDNQSTPLIPWGISTR